LSSCPEIVIWLAVVGGTGGPPPALGVTAVDGAGDATADEAVEAAAGFGLAARGLARRAALT
jgi:hypothetical protein